MAKYLSAPWAPYQIGSAAFAKKWMLIDTVSSYAQVTTAGYLSDQQALGHVFSANDLMYIQYLGGAGWFNLSIDVNNNITLSGSAIIASNMASVAITAAQFLGMYAAPVQLIAAPGANRLIVVNSMQLVLTYGTAAFAGGGVVAAQYDSTVHGAGVLATNSEAAADFAVTASTTFNFISESGNTVGALPFSTTVNKGLYLSNATGAFTTGDSTIVAKVRYEIIATA